MRNNRYYHTCPCCGANLDPGERCDCKDTEENRINRISRRMLYEH